MYQDIIKVLDLVIDKHKEVEIDSVTEENRHYFIQGLEVAKQQIEQLEDLHSDELAYETLEITLESVKDRLSSEDVHELVDRILD